MKDVALIFLKASGEAVEDETGTNNRRRVETKRGVNFGDQRNTSHQGCDPRIDARVLGQECDAAKKIWMIKKQGLEDKESSVLSITPMLELMEPWKQFMLLQVFRRKRESWY